MNILLEKLLKSEGVDKKIIDYITDTLCPSDFGLEHEISCEGGCTDCWNETLKEKPRKTSMELLKECLEVGFDFNDMNYYIYVDSSDNMVYMGSNSYDRIEGIKYISWEDAEYITRECQENN